MNGQPRTRRTLLLRLATLTVTAGLAAGAVGTAVGSEAPSPTQATTTVAAPSTITDDLPSAPRYTARPGRSTSAVSGAERTVARSGQTAAATNAPRAGRPAARRTIYIRSYLDRMGSQAAVDTGKLVLWWDKPYWLAGHNYRGWQWMAFVPTGAKVVVTSGRAAGTYVVTGHKRLNRQSGPMPQVRADLVLQTCVGSKTGLTLLKRTGVAPVSAVSSPGQGAA